MVRRSLRRRCSSRPGRPSFRQEAAEGWRWRTGGGGGGGNIVAGGFTVAKTTVTLPSTGTNTSESIGGKFSSYTQAEWQYPFSAPTFGACSVLDITGPGKSSVPTGCISGRRYDHGKRTQFTVWHNGTEIHTNGQIGPSYVLIDATGTTLANGGTYTISGSGGTQVGPFTASATLPQSFTVTNWDAITAINRANGLTVNWSGTGFNTVVITATGQSWQPVRL